MKTPAMKKNSFMIVFLLAQFLIGCGNNEKKNAEKKLQPVNQLNPVSVNDQVQIVSDSLEIKTETISNNSSNPKAAFTVKKSIAAKTQLPTAKNKNTNLKASPDLSENLMAFVNLRKILDEGKIGQTLTQKELTQNFKIPEEAVKLVKSVTKTAENEIDIKWKSTWLVEKISDAKFTDARMKIKFEANKMYTSGKAIGIKYNKKIYNDLIIIGSSAYIPSVKGYHWQIGK